MKYLEMLRAAPIIGFLFIASMSTTLARPVFVSLHQEGAAVDELVTKDHLFNDPAMFTTFGKAVTGMDLGEISRATRKLQGSLAELDLDTFMGELNSHLSRLTVRPVANYEREWCRAILYLFLRVAALRPLYAHFTEFYEKYGILTLEMQTAQDSMMLIFDVSFDGNVGQAYQKLVRSEPDDLFYVNRTFRARQILCVMMNFDLKAYKVDDWTSWWRGKVPEAVTTTTTTDR